MSSDEENKDVYGASRGFIRIEWPMELVASRLSYIFLKGFFFVYS